MKRFILFYLIICLGECIPAVNAFGQETKKDFLQKAIDNLEKINTASYFLKGESRQPGDTVEAKVYYSYEKEATNKADTTIGAKLVSFDAKDTTRLNFAYDGTKKIQVYEEEKGILLDNFTVRKLPFRPVPPPFFNYIKSILNYTLTTGDSISTEMKDLGCCIHFKLTIHENRQVEFFGRAFYMDSQPGFITDPTSVYEVWFDKASLLPFKYRREMEHQTTISTCSSVVINQLKESDLDPTRYYPKGFIIKQRTKKDNKLSVPAILGKKAPDFSLTDTEGNVTSLKDFKSKVLLVEFTGVGCGACQLAVPFLKELKNKYPVEQFDIAAIESWTHSLHEVQFYKKRKTLNYSLLVGAKETIDAYQTKGAAPVFFLLDKDRIIRKIFQGYGKGNTDINLENTIQELLK